MARDKDIPNAMKDGNDILQYIVGDFGKWQFKIAILMALLKFPIAWFHLNIVFLVPPTSFWCKKPDHINVSVADWHELTVPSKQNISRESLNSGFCYMKNVGNLPKEAWQNVTDFVTCSERYEYNRTVFTSTVVTEWNLVCGNQRYIDLVQISLMTGVLFGSSFFGFFADRRGRKTTLLICIFLQSLLGLAASWVPWYWGFIILRFLIGFANGGTIVSSFVLCMEVVGGKWRRIIAILFHIPYSIGISLMALIAYFIRDWRYMYTTISLLSVLFISYTWIIPESPRWLLTVGKKREACNILQKAAITNNNCKNPVEVENVLSEMQIPKSTKKPSLWILFSTKELRKRVLLLSTMWFILGITYFGFMQYMGHISSNIFLAVGSISLSAFPGSLVCVYLIAKIGCRRTFIWVQTLASGCFFLILATPAGHFYLDWPRIVFAAIGKFFLLISLSTMYLLTGEAYPTVVRNAGMGVSLTFTRIGSMVAPLFISLRDVHWCLPLILMGIGSVVAVFLIIPLPESSATKLMETVDDLEKQKHHREEPSEEYAPVSTQDG